IVAVGQTVEHSRRTLRAAIAWIRTESGERNSTEPAQLDGGGFDQQSDFPVASVETKRDRLSIRRAQTALRADDQKFFAPKLGRIPAHAGILGEAENVAAGLVEEHFRRERELAGGSFGPGGKVVNLLARG